MCLATRDIRGVKRLIGICYYSRISCYLNECRRAVLCNKVVLVVVVFFDADVEDQKEYSCAGEEANNHQVSRVISSATLEVGARRGVAHARVCV